jgi:hypothetical protein
MQQKEEGPVNITEIINTKSIHQGCIIKSPVQITHIRWMNRYDQVIHVPKRFNITGVTERNHIASFTDNKKWWAVQYHPESYKYGDLYIFKKFLKIKYKSSNDIICPPLKENKSEVTAISNLPYIESLDLPLNIKAIQPIVNKSVEIQTHSCDNQEINIMKEKSKSCSRPRHPNYIAKV